MSWATSAHTLEVEDVTLGITQRLGVEGLGVRADRATPRLEVVGIVHEGDLDPELGQRVVKEVVGAAIERGRRDDVATVLGQVQQRDGLGSLSARHGERGDAAFERRDAVLEDGLGGIHDAGVDVPEFLETEECGGVRRVAKDVAGRLVDRNGPGVRRRVGCGARRESDESRIPIRAWCSPSLSSTTKAPSTRREVVFITKTIEVVKFFAILRGAEHTANSLQRHSGL